MEEEDEWRASGIIGNKVRKMRAPHPVFGRDNIEMDWDYMWISFVTPTSRNYEHSRQSPFKLFFPICHPICNIFDGPSYRYSSSKVTLHNLIGL